MFAKNVTTFLQHLIKDGKADLDLNDEITRDTLLTYEGQVVNNRIREMLGMAVLEPAVSATAADATEHASGSGDQENQENQGDA